MSGLVGAVACPGCGETVPPGSRFCEACGAELVGPVAAPGPGGPAPTPCPGCGGAPDATDGYCAHCGMKQPAPDDHVETDLGAAASVTDRGRRHHRNEDACAIVRVVRPSGVVRVLVVCDGVSSTSDSHLAARGAARAACDHLERISRDAVALTDDVVIAALGGAVRAAQDAVLAVPGSGGENPSCTFVATVAVDVPDAQVLLVSAWLGDSRAYVIEAGAATQLSDDDSWAGDEIAAGADPAVAFADPRAHSITRWLGADAVDLVPRTDVRTVPATARALLCSDGLWNYAPGAADLSGLLASRAALAPLALARSLTEFALEAGGHDNITVVVADLDQ